MCCKLYCWLQVGLEDLDGLQQELEAMLSAAVSRKRHLRAEGDILANLDKYKGRQKRVSCELNILSNQFADVKFIFLLARSQDSEVKFSVLFI